MKKELSVLIIILVCVVFGFFAMPVKAQISFPIVVQNTSDTVVAGACTQGGSTSNCSLRGAITAANTIGNNVNIQFSIPATDPFCAAGVCTINLGSELPTIIANNISIAGPGADRLIVKPATGVTGITIFDANSTGTVSISGVTIRDTVNASGIFQVNGILNVTNCRLINNQGGVDGGGIAKVAGTLNVINSTISSNTVNGLGGGIYSSGVTLNVTNSTIYANSASQSGGGIYIDGGGTVNITNSTIAGNSQTLTNGGGGGGGVFVVNSTVNVKNSIIAGNSNAFGVGPDVNGNFNSAGFNLIGKRDASNGFTNPTDLTGTIAAPLNPRLDPAGPQSNGGATPTIRLLPGSPAIDKATSLSLTSGILTTDQRSTGFARTIDGPAGNAVGGDGTDIGALETPGGSKFDFDGDAKTDLAIFRPGPGEWWVNRSSTGVTFAAQFGLGTDKIAAADFTGDGKTDIAFWRPSTGQWFILRSEDSNFFAFPFGTTGDVPVPADFDGDGKTDPAVFRPSDATWYIRRSSDSQVAFVPFGVSTDSPVPADYDGDGRADVGITRVVAGVRQWWIQRSTAGLQALQFGVAADRATPGDFTGDGKADIAFWRPSTGFWFILRSEDLNFYAFPFGATGDVPVPGDYDGDGKTDAAVFRPSDTNWYISRSTQGTLIQQFGAATDTPVPSAFVP